MAELSLRQRLQPSLLDRLTDEAPDEIEESRRQRVLVVPKLREAVLRDLSWLLNSENMGGDDLREFPFVASSVLNFGLPALAGATVSGVDPKELARRLRRAILDFEPRLLPDTVVVRATAVAGESSHNALIFVIEGTLWAQPLPLALFMKTEIDLESGSVSVVESSMDRQVE